jgi:hypothetical protein
VGGHERRRSVEYGNAFALEHAQFPEPALDAVQRLPDVG